MIDRVERLPRPQPNVADLLAVLHRRRPERVPLFDLKIDEEVVSALLGEPCTPWSKDTPADLRARYVRQYVGIHHRLGYDTIRLRTDIPFTFTRHKTTDTAGLSRGQREWQNEATGPIQNLADFERYPWPTPQSMHFGPVEEVLRTLPEGMAVIGFSGGVFEWASWLMGLEGFCVALYDCPELVRAVVDRVGALIYAALETWARTDGVPILWVGDDMGFKTGTLISLQHLREYILPWHRRYAELAHRHGKFYVLHSCGNVAEIMPDLAGDVGIDAKHSFEDVIQPVEDFHRQWGHQVAALGGVDVDLLARGDEESVRRRTLHILETCAPRGAYACGSGNSVTNYVPPNNFLTMIETLHQFNGRM